MTLLRFASFTVGALVLAGCSWFSSKDDGCQTILVSIYPPPIVSTLDYGLIPGSKSQVIVAGAFQHMLSIPGRTLPPAVPLPSGLDVSDFLTRQERIVHFKFNSTNLSFDDQRKLDRFIASLSPSDTIHIRVTGHTDAIGGNAYNQRLSTDRALVVKRYLMAHGIAPGRVTTMGFGERMPIASNSTMSGRAQNRRAEFTPIN